MFNAYYNFLLEFSYWPIFSQQVYSFIVGMYFLDIFIAMMLESMLCESLLIAPIDVCINVIENTMTMGAASFVDFMVSFMVRDSALKFPSISELEVQLELRGDGVSAPPRHRGAIEAAA